MITDREREIKDIFGKDLFEMTPQELIENRLTNDWCEAIEANADWMEEQEE